MDVLIWFDGYIKQNPPDQKKIKSCGLKLIKTEQIINNAVWIEGKFISVNDF
jgi:hypothetical protein